MAENGNMVRHAPVVMEKVQWLQADGYPEGLQLQVAQTYLVCGLALVNTLADGPQLVIALQRLIDSRDAAIRQAAVDQSNLAATDINGAVE